MTISEPIPTEQTPPVQQTEDTHPGGCCTGLKPLSDKAKRILGTALVIASIAGIALSIAGSLGIVAAAAGVSILSIGSASFLSIPMYYNAFAAGTLLVGTALSALLARTGIRQFKPVDAA